MTDELETPAEDAPEAPKATKTPKAKAKPAEPTGEAKEDAPVSAPAKRVAPKDSVVGNGDTDHVVYSRVRPEGYSRTRKSLTVHHLQRRLAWLGHGEAYADTDGAYGALTRQGVQAWQEANGHEPTGLLTARQFLEVFEGDPNVTAVVDVPGALLEG